MATVGGLLKCPMISLWVLFALHFIYLLLIFILKKYISLVYLIIDIAILLDLELTALFISLSHKRNKYNFYLISFALSIINFLCDLFGIFIIIFSFFEKETLYNFIKPEPWIEKDGKAWIGIILIIGKIIDLFPLIILSKYCGKIRKTSGSIEPMKINYFNKPIIGESPEEEERYDDNLI